MKQLIFSVAALTSILVSAQASADCASLRRAYDLESKYVSLAWAETVPGDDAAQRSAKWNEVVARMISRQMNLTLMLQNRCKIPENPVYIGEYAKDALQCRMAESTGDPDSPLCDVSKWTRGGSSEAANEAQRRPSSLSP